MHLWIYIISHWSKKRIYIPWRCKWDIKVALHQKNTPPTMDALRWTLEEEKKERDGGVVRVDFIFLFFLLLSCETGCVVWFANCNASCSCLTFFYRVVSCQPIKKSGLTWKWHKHYKNNTNAMSRRSDLSLSIEYGKGGLRERERREASISRLNSNGYSTQKK